MPTRNGRPEIAGLDAVVTAVVHPHVLADPTQAAVGLLIGRPARPDGLPLVTAAIPLDESVITLAGWEAACHAYQSERGDQVVGWYAGRPGSGAKLRRSDRLLAEPPTTPITLVCDPQSAVEAVFLWADGEPMPLLRRPLAVAPVTDLLPQRLERAALLPRSGPAPQLIAALLVGLVVGFASWQLVA